MTFTLLLLFFGEILTLGSWLQVPANNADSKDIAETVTKTGALAALHQDSGAVLSVGSLWLMSICDARRVDPTSSTPGSRIVDFPPGGDKSHRTSSVDFAVVLSGEICMELEPGDEIVLKTGDSLVQRGWGLLDSQRIV